MITENVVIEAEVKIKGDNSVKSLKAELRSLKNELGQLDPNSEAFLTAAKRAGQLQDQIEDVNNTVKAFNPEAKFQAFAGVLTGVANGFSAIQGAQALFGSENEDIQKAILKTQGAIALATGLNGLMGMGDAFKNLALVIKTNVVAAFATLKTTLITSGIGALVIALGVAINEIIKYNESVDAEADAQKKLNEELDRTNEAMSKQASESEKVRNARKGGLNDLNNELMLLEARGATEEEIFKKRQQILEKELSNLKTRKYSGLDVTKEIADKETEIEASKLAHQKKLNDEAKADKLKSIEEAKRKAEEAARAEERGLAERRKTYDTQQKYLQSQEVADAEARKSQTEKELQEYADLENEYRAEDVAGFKANVDAKIALQKTEEEARLATMQATSAGLNAISQLVGEQTAAGKALGVASATIDTYVGATKALAQGGSFGFVSAGAIVLAGLANVKRILAVKVPSINGASANALPSAPTSVPQIPQISTTTTLTQGSTLNTRQLNVSDSRVYVVESDITNTQNKVKVIVRKATIK